jgi:hypothetical protein
MDFVFMLTRDDRTVDDALDVVDAIADAGVAHVGFKDVGIEPARAAELHHRIKALGATSYLEVVSTSPDDVLRSARLGRALGVDRLLGGSPAQAADVMTILGGSNVAYLPFAGRPFGHPTQLRGAPDDIAHDCRSLREHGAAGCDLLAYRSIEADPLALVRAARGALGDGILLVAGGVTTAGQVSALAAAGVDAFTVGSAALAGVFTPAAGPSLREQLAAILDACAR